MNGMTQNSTSHQTTVAEIYSAAYRKAQDTDDSFQAALVAQFGKEAGDARYQSSKHNEQVKSARFAFRMASEELRQATVALRSESN